MTRNNNLAEAHRWLEQAQHDLAAAKVSMREAIHEWACFQSQQAAEKALKAFLYFQGKRVITTHSIRELLTITNEYTAVSDDLRDAKALDEVYIPSRYPNGLPDGVPHDFYTEKDASRCVQYAEAIVTWVKSLIPTS